MALEQPLFCDGNEVAAADLSTKQFYAVKLTSTGYALCSVAGEPCDGILQDDPLSGKVCNVMVHGISKAIAGGAIAKGANVTVDANGKLAVAASGNYILGRLKEAATADGDIVTLLINRHGRLA